MVGPATDSAPQTDTEGLATKLVCGAESGAGPAIVLSKLREWKSGGDSCSSCYIKPISCSSSPFGRVGDRSSSVMGSGGRYFLLKNIKPSPALIFFTKKYLPPQANNGQTMAPHAPEGTTRATARPNIARTTLVAPRHLVPAA